MMVQQHAQLKVLTPCYHHPTLQVAANHHLLLQALAFVISWPDDPHTVNALFNNFIFIPFLPSSQKSFEHAIRKH